MAAQAWFTSDDIKVAPGSAGVLRLVVANLSAVTDTFTITPSGLAAGWTTVHPANITLFGGSQQEVEVRIAPPALPGTTAGPSLLSVRIVPHLDPDHTAAAETTITITPTHQRELTLLQPVVSARRNGDIELLLDNRGNSQATCRLQLIEPTGRISGQFDPPSLSVAPGTSGLARLRLRTDRPLWDRQPRTITFRVDADQAGGPLSSAHGTFVHTPMLTDHAVTRFGGFVLALAIVVGGWFALVRPAIDDAAERAARDTGSSTAAGSNSGTDSGSGGTPSNGATQVVVNAEAVGDLISFALQLDVAAGAQGRAEYTVPDGQRLLVTDIVVQNPTLDQGMLRVLRNADALATFGLANVFADVGMPLVSPIELTAGQTLSAELDCTGVGDPVIGTCQPSVFVSGRLVTD